MAAIDVVIQFVAMPVTIIYRFFASPIGRLLITSSDGVALSGLYMEEHRRGPTPGDGWRRDDDALPAVAEQLRAYFAGELLAFNLPLALAGTPFQRSVWSALAEIRFGQTLGYGQIAARLGAPRAARAVGAAVGRNPVSVIVPCHRAVGADGSLTDFAGGLARKRWLFEHEQGVLADRAGLAASAGWLCRVVGK
jgi:methylated-DNA-[protein]-cysteine S-methyltransferase